MLVDAAFSFSYTLLGPPPFFFFFFFNDTATTEIYTLSLHDALPISFSREGGIHSCWILCDQVVKVSKKKKSKIEKAIKDRKSTRLNSSHTVISYAVFCLKKKKKTA